jgi:hypothetical protein
MAGIASGCISNNNSTLPTIGEPQSSSTPVTLPESTATLLSTTVTVIGVPSLTVLPTQTLLPTLEPGDIEDIIRALHSKCELSCWGNIIPGQTSEFAAKHILSSFGELGPKSISFQYDDKPIVIDLTFKDGLVNSINLPPPIAEFFNISHLLSEYGTPEDIQAEIIPETAEGTSWFTLVLVYPQHGFFAIFSGEGSVVDSSISICPKDVAPDLYLVKSNNYSLEEMNGFVSLILQQPLQPLDSLTDIDKNQFHEIFSKNKDQCLTTNVQAP